MAMLNNQRVSFSSLCLQMSVVKHIQTRLDTNHARRPRKNQTARFLIRQSSGRCWKHRSGMSRWRWRSQWCSFLHDIMTNQDTEVTWILLLDTETLKLRTGWWFQTFGLFFQSVGNVIIPTDEVHHFSEGLFYHQPENLLLNIPKSRVKLADPQQHRVKVNYLVEHITLW